MLHTEDTGRREVNARRGAACFTKSGDAFSAFMMWAVAAESAALSGRLDDARGALAEAMRLCDPAWPIARQRMLTSAQGTIASCSGDTAGAVRWWQQLAAINRSCGLSNVRELAALADAELRAGHAEQARRHLEEAEALLDGPREDRERFAYVLPNLCAACLAAGDVQSARSAAEQGWHDARRFDADAWWADHLALLAALEDRTRTAALLLGRSDAAYARIHSDATRLRSTTCGKRPSASRPGSASSRRRRCALPGPITRSRSGSTRLRLPPLTRQIRSPRSPPSAERQSRDAGPGGHNQWAADAGRCMGRGLQTVCSCNPATHVRLALALGGVLRERPLRQALDWHSRP